MIFFYGTVFKLVSHLDYLFVLDLSVEMEIGESRSAFKSR